MLRWLAISAIALTLCVYLPPRSEAQKSPEKSAQKSPDKGDPSAFTYVENRRDETKAQTPQGKLPNGYISPEWAIVIVGIITFVVIGWQSWETRKAAEATKESAKASRDSIEVIQRKERGRLRIDLAQPDIHPIILKSMSGISLYALQMKIVLDGSSEATIIESNELGRICKNGLNPSAGKLLKTNWPRVVNSQNSPVSHFCTCFIDEGNSLNAGINKELTDSLRKGDWFFLYEAHFRYRDVFGDIWVSRIKQRFNFIVLPDDVRAVMPPRY